MSLSSAATELARAPGVIGAIDIGGTKIAAGLVSRSGRLRASRTWPTAPERGFEAALTQMVAALREAQTEIGEEIIGIGIGSTGPVDPFRGTIGEVALLPGWRGAPIVARLAAEFGVNVALENDADAAALAEALWGVGRSAECLLYVTISTGIGVGIVRRGELYRGAAGAHPELGHMSLGASAPTKCYCGQSGCWESLASGSALEAWYAADAGVAGERVRAKEIFVRASAGDAVALHAVEREAHYLGLGLANLITSFCPDVIALGGGMMRDAAAFLPQASALAQRLASQVPAHRTRIELAQLGSDVGLAGAAALWLHRFTHRRRIASAEAEGNEIEPTLVRAFLENVPDAVYFKDRASRIIASSASNAAKLGCRDASELTGKSDFDLFAESHARRAFEDEQRIMRTGEPLLDKPEKETWPDGRVTWALTSKLPLRDARGTIIGTFGITKDVTKTKEMEMALEKARRELMDATRLAGMAEVATGVLHNVGNVLNSVNVSATVITDGLRYFKIESLAKLCVLLREHSADLGRFLVDDPRGQRVLEFLESLTQNFQEERVRLVREAAVLQQNVDHIKDIVAMQQAYATMVGVVEPLEPATLMEEALRMNSGALVRHEVEVVRDFHPVPPLLAERGKVLQILVNLIRNAKYACGERGHADKRLILRIEPGAAGRVRLVVQDNGIGIPSENLTRIFNHGFTTRKGGHGFGLHFSALAATEMRGALTVHSDGPNTGATFVLELPTAANDAAADRNVLPSAAE